MLWPEPISGISAEVRCTSETGLKMKAAPKVTKSRGPVRSTQPAPAQKERGKAPQESLNLSPERIEDGVLTKTTILEGILGEGERACHFRHWGINE